MASRGAVAKNGHVTTSEFETVAVLDNGAKVLKGTTNNHGLPDYSHSPNAAYVKLNDGIFKEMRIYDEKGNIEIEFGYHGEINLTGNRHEKILHYHFFGTNLKHLEANKMNDYIYKKYKNYLEEIKKWIK